MLELRHRLKLKRTKMSANITEATTSSVSQAKPDQLVGISSIVMALLAATISLVGCVLNYFCYRTAEFLPESTTKYLMKHLAVWDTVSLVHAVVFETIFQNSFVHLGSLRVSICFFSFGASVSTEK